MSENFIVHVEAPVPLEQGKEENRAKNGDGEPISDEEVTALVLKAIPEWVRNRVDCYVTGMNEYFSKSLQSLSERGVEGVPAPSDATDEGVESFFIKQEKFEDDKDVVNGEKSAADKADEWQRKQLYVEPYDRYYEHRADLVIVANFGYGRGQQILNHAAQEGVPAMQVSIIDALDTDYFFGGQEDEEADQEDDDEEMPTVSDTDDLDSLAP